MTREEWLEARDRVRTSSVAVLSEGQVHRLTEAALGCPCPPEPAPEPFRLDAYTLVKIAGLDKIAVPRHLLTPAEADAMSEALRAHADYARKQEAPPGNRERPRAFAPNPGDEPICGRLRVGGDPALPVCVRPKGHAGFCQEGLDE